MLDKFNRDISYMRISLTDKCNLRCTYCMPEEGMPLKNHNDFLTYEDIAEIVQAGVKLGIRKIRLTGGEPLVKKGIIELVRLLKSIKGLETLAMTTNGVLLKNYAEALKKAGLDSINISLDSIDPERYRQITRIGDIKNALEGIDAAIAAGFKIKINMVVMNDTADDEINAMKTFCASKMLKLQLINHYSLTEDKSNAYEFDRPPKCGACDRIRLLSDGSLKSCLHSDEEFKLDMNNIEEVIKKTILSKPAAGSVCTNRNMVEIGG